MSYYEDVYKKRLNRYGTDHQSRMQGKREKNFEIELARSVFRVDFLFNGELTYGILERYKQNETETMQYLRTKVGVDLPAGTVLSIEDYTGNVSDWLVCWPERITSSGYNKYIVLRLTHEIEWTSRDGEKFSLKTYFYGQEDNMLKDEIRSRSRMDAIYAENLKLSFFVCATDSRINKDDYFELLIKDINDKTITQAYRVTGFDIVSTPGIEYVSVDPIYIYDKSPKPEQGAADDANDYFWLSPQIEEG